MLNKLAGNAPVSYKFLPHEKGGTINYGLTSKAGIKLEYTELPYEWVFPYMTWAEFFPTSGPLSYFRMSYDFEINEKNTICHIKIEYCTRKFAFLGKLFIQKLFSLFKNTSMKVLQKSQKDDLMGLAPYWEKDPELNINQNELKKIFSEFHSNSELIDKIIKFLAYAPDKHVARIRPLLVAAHYHISENELIEFFLKATRHGLFDMSWDILCPSCRGDKRKVKHLVELSKSAHCDYCDIKYDASFSKNVELTFRPSGKIRKINIKNYCINSPANTPHVYAQINSWPDEPLNSRFHFKEKNYKLEVVGFSTNKKIQIDEKNGKEKLEIFLSENWMLEEETLVLTSRPILIIHNRLNPNYPVTVKFLSEGYRDYALLASRVTGIQEFRDLFSSEVLAPGLELGIENLTFLFTDLKDSTPMYEEMGDASAFALVRDHFDILTNSIKLNNGAVVKTIGDAVMAVFQTNREAQLSAIQILVDMKTKFPNASVKIGIHSGSCIAVTSNEKLDYFGSTVNKAARIQGLSIGSDIVMNQEIDNPDLFSPNQFQKEIFQSKLKGISGDVSLIRYIYKI